MNAPSSAPSMTSQQLPTYIERPNDAADMFAVWPGSGVPPGSENWTWHEQAMPAPPEMGGGRMVRNVVIPTHDVRAYCCDSERDRGDRRTRRCVPFLMMNHEGDDVARWLANVGVTAFVLRYRLNRTPESDAEMPAFLERLFNVLPHPSRTDVNPPVANAPTCPRSPASGPTPPLPPRGLPRQSLPPVRVSWSAPLITPVRLIPRK
jgi:hypothetical protein